MAETLRNHVLQIVNLSTEKSQFSPLTLIVWIIVSLNHVKMFMKIHYFLSYSKTFISNQNHTKHVLPISATKLFQYRFFNRSYQIPFKSSTRVQKINAIASYLPPPSTNLMNKHKCNHLRCLIPVIQNVVWAEVGQRIWWINAEPFHLAFHLLSRLSDRNRRAILLFPRSYLACRDILKTVWGWNHVKRSELWICCPRFVTRCR